MKTRLLSIFLLGVCGLTPLHPKAESVRLAASTPMPSYADPFAIDSGVGVIPAIFDALTLVDNDGTLQPALAMSWDIVNETTWQFQLRPGVAFSNGIPLDAEVVADQLNFLASPDALIFPIVSEVGTIESARALSPLTVEVVTRQPDAVLARKLSRIPIVPMDVWAEMGRTEFSKAPIGTGPYKIDRWGAGGASGVTMSRSERSWRQVEDVETVEYVILTDPSSRLQSLLSESVDISIAIDLDSIPAVEAAGYRVRTQLGPMVLALVFRNCAGANPLIKDVRVREALTVAVDRRRIIENLMGSGEPFVFQGGTPGVLGFNPALNSFDFNPERARALLRDAGFNSNKPLVVGVFTGQFLSDALIYQLVAQYWSAVGVQTEVRRMAFPEYIRRFESGDWEGIDLMSAVWSHYQLGDVSRSLKRFSGAHSAPLFCAPELVEDVIATDSEINEITRGEKLEGLMERLHNQIPSLPLVQYVSVSAYGPRIVEYKSRTGAILFEQMRLRPVDDAR